MSAKVDNILETSDNLSLRTLRPAAVLNPNLMCYNSENDESNTDFDINSYEPIEPIENWDDLSFFNQLEPSLLNSSICDNSKVVGNSQNNTDGENEINQCGPSTHRNADGNKQAISGPAREKTRKQRC